MIAHAKLRWCQLAHVIQTSGNVEDALATFALKMVMVSTVRALVARRLAGNLDCVDPAALE